MSPALAADITVQDTASLQAALRVLKPGTTLKIAPGTYPGGHQTRGMDDLTIEALDPKNPPVFQGGNGGWQFTRCHRLTLRHLRFQGHAVNGLNLDDGGQRTSPVKGITLDHVEVSDIGPTGNHDGIKCSGLDELTIRDCTVTGWGGQGIDFVGCHKSLVTGCRFIGKTGFSASAAIQMKGGSSDITVEKCHFKDAGQRPVNVGGSTGLDYFRPPEAAYEGKNLTVQDCIIEGSLSAAAFVGVDGAVFTRNTILFPEKWVFRILQETRGDRFPPCRNVKITDNRIAFRRAQVQTEVNIGTGTAPETFVFANNHWFAEDRPDRSKPTLPAAETGGVYGKDPREKR
ncbi:MAG: right-handed parallel beta-helix repeat-containing protein [Verrucomicrobiota bacterium]